MDEGKPGLLGQVVWLNSRWVYNGEGSVMKRDTVW